MHDVRKKISKPKIRMRKVVIPIQTFRNIIRIKDEFDSMIETIEIMNDRELMRGIERSREDVKAGRVRELKSIEELWK